MIWYRGLHSKHNHKFSVHEKYGNSNSGVNFNAKIFLTSNVVNSVNYKYTFLTLYKISDTFVQHFAINTQWHDRRLNSKKCASPSIKIDTLACVGKGE